MIASSNLRKGLFPLLAAILAFPLNNAVAKEKQTVTVSYLLQPGKPLPPRLKSLAVIDSGVSSDEEKHTYREKKWSDIAADLMEAMLNSQPTGQETRLTVVNRGNTKQILAEQDMQLAGIIEGDAASKAGKILAVDGFIMSKMNFHISVQKTRKSEMDWMALLGGGGQPEATRRPTRYRTISGDQANRRRNAYRDSPAGHGGGPGLPMRDVEQISRSLTVQCSFSLVDATTGETLLKYSPPVFQKRDKKSPDFLFGRSVDAADLDPVDHFIGELVEQAARDFVSMIVPVRVQYTYEVIGKSKHGEAAVRALRADNYDMALREFEEAHRDKPDRVENVFALGVVSEILGRYDAALDYYRKVCAMKDVDEDDLPMYMAAKDRLTQHIGRILGPDNSARPRAVGMQPPKGENSHDSKHAGKHNDKNHEEDDD